MNRELEILATFLYKTIENIPTDIGANIEPFNVYHIQDVVKKHFDEGEVGLAMRLLSDALSRHNNAIFRKMDEVQMIINNIKSIESILEIYANDSVKNNEKEKKGK